MPPTYVTYSSLRLILAEISTSASAGPDRFPAILLKNCQKILSRPLYKIWCKSLDSGEIPLLMKKANIIPVHKGGSLGLPKNYRPIALTSHLTKVFEKVIRTAIGSYMERNNLFNPSQHGFRHGHSCLSQLIAHYDQVLQLLEEGKNIDVIYVDFAKAFDKFDFMVTLQKIEKLGIGGKMGSWIHAFITNRVQQVLVAGARSRPCDVISGVPQGSVLGPLLFLILIGDIDRGLSETFLSSFADGTRIGSAVDSTNDIQALQVDLDTVYRYSHVNNMELNASKFECLRYGNNTDLQSWSPYKSNTGSTFTEKDSVNDLGVEMSKDATFKKHIQNVIDSTNNQCSWILRTFRTRHAQAMLTLWKSLVLCKLDYCSQLWCPSEKGDIQSLEMVLRSFLRKLQGQRNLSYWDQLHHLRLYSLERRRERYLIIYVWRILEAQVPNPSGKYAITANTHPRRGRECIIPQVSNTAPRRIQTLRYASLPIRGARLFNILPAHTRNITRCSVNVFKGQLDKFLLTVPDESQITGDTAQRRAQSNRLSDVACHAHTRNRMEVLSGNPSAMKIALPALPWHSGVKRCNKVR